MPQALRQRQEQPVAVDHASLDPETRQATALFMARVAGRFDVRQALLFGSRARRSHRPDSDADVAVILRGPPQRFLAAKRAMADIAFDVLLETGVKVQPLPVWDDEWQHPESYSNPALLRNIAAEGVNL